MSQKWWQLDAHALQEAVGTHIERGLSLEEAAQRLIKVGPNRLEEKKPPSLVILFLGQFNDFIVWVLIVASVVSGFLGEWIDAFAIVAIIILNSVLGFIQEYKAERSLAALKKLSRPLARAIRSGEKVSIPAFDIVPGDLIELEAGDHVPADSRLVYVTGNFTTQEASLTGESTPVHKTAHRLEEHELPLADRANIVYTGTSVTSGKARAVVVETGMRTELGRIAGLIQGIDETTTPLQKRLDEFGKTIVYVCFALVAIVFLLGLARGGKAIDMFMTAVSLAVAAIPEGLPAVVTIALAIGVQRMVKRNALIRKLPSVETLGCATIICSDKTGTLTKNEMTVRSVCTGSRAFAVSGTGFSREGLYSVDGAPVTLLKELGLRAALEAATLCNNAGLTEEAGRFKITGDPTEAALLVAAVKAGIDRKELEAQNTFVDELPFDSERKKMTVIRRRSGGVMAFVKGAPDVLFEDCVSVEEGGVTRPLSASDRSRILDANAALTGQAMRVLAVAYRPLEESASFEQAAVERDLIFLGLIGMIDPPREEVKEAIKACKEAGIATVMITGDHKNTAVAVARELGFFGADSVALTGAELDQLDEQAFDSMVLSVSVYARVSPEHKLRIVKALKKHRNIVAMTGDGVNDAPAVKEADIGVAMGITGTDVTKEVSDMVVTDDNFASIVAAVEEGRGIYDNIKKFIHYLLSCNAGEILIMFIASLIGIPTPLLPIHILWVNLVTDGFPALALGMDPVDRAVMRRKPRNVDEPVVTRQRGLLLLLQGSFIAFCGLATFTFVLYIDNGGLVKARTAAFTVLAMSQIFHSFNCRSMTRSIFDLGIMTNRNLVIAALTSAVLQAAVIYLPVFERVFKTEPLNAVELAVVIVFSSLPLWGMEIVKRIAPAKSFLQQSE